MTSLKSKSFDIIATTTKKRDYDDVSNETPSRTNDATSSLLPTAAANSTNGLYQHLNSTNMINNNRLSYEDLLLTSARQQLEKQTLISELIKRNRPFENVAVHPTLTNSSALNSNSMMSSADDYYHRSINNAQPVFPSRSSNNRMVSDECYCNRGIINNNISNTQPAIVVSSDILADNNGLLRMLRQRYQDPKIISDILKNKQRNNDNILNHSMNVNDLLNYGYQRSQRIDNNTLSLLNSDRIALLSNSLLQRMSPLPSDIVAAAAKTNNNNGLNNSIQMNNNNNNIGMELLILQKKREIYNTMLYADHSFISTKRRRTDAI